MAVQGEAGGADGPNDKDRPRGSPVRSTEWSDDGGTRIDTWHRDTAAKAVIEDPFAWLEQPSEAVTAWTEEQQRRMRDFLDQVSETARAEIGGSLERMYQRDEIEAPYRRGGRVFQKRRKPKQQHAALYVYEAGDDLDGEGRLVIDPNEMSPDGTVSVDWTYPSRDGRYVAYGLSEKGSEESTMRIRDVETGEDLEDSIPHTKFSYVSWLPDGSGFYYMRYPDPQEIPPGDERHMRRAYFHELGADYIEDQLVFETEGVSKGSSYVYVSPDGEWAVAGVLKGGGDSDFYLAKLQDGRCSQKEFQPIFTTEGAQMRVIGFNDGYFWV